MEEKENGTYYIMLFIVSLLLESILDPYSTFGKIVNELKSHLF